MTLALLTRMSAPPSSCWTQSAAATTDSRSVTSASNGDRAASELVGQHLDAVGASGQQRDPAAVGGQRAGGRLAYARGGTGDDRDAAGVPVGAHAVTSSSASDEDSSR
jgi:hypothetical protein